ncbi:response regulator [Falsiroseomonas sp. E2-1-a4]|uniref:response regulator n=1 Tax=Falsiroseomonas sp. E2-1-a4 TaxID=3239299 RepID=UPI003F395C9B
MTTLDRDLLDAFVPEFEAEAVRLAMVRDAAAAGRALDQLRAMAAALGAPSLATLVDRTAQALDPLDWPALHAGAEALARQAVAIGAVGADVPLAEPPAPEPAPVPPAAPAALLDREMLEAFAPEFAAACDRLAQAADAAQAGWALDGLRAMAGAVELGSLLRLLEPASALLDPFDAAALAGLSAALRAQSARIVKAGADLAPPDPAPAPAVAALDAELLEAFAPEFAAGCARLGTAPDAAAAARATEALRAMAASLGLDSLRAMLAEAPSEDLAALPALATALAAHAAAIAATGHDLPPPLPAAGPARRRVLVVDDSAMMRRLVREALALDPEFEVVGEAADGIQALAALQRLAPDLTMLDIEMPELDGLGALRRWALEGGGAVVIVSSAARPGSATAVEARRLGAAGIVGKPSGALSPDLRERQGAALLRTARRAAGLPVEALR